MFVRNISVGRDFTNSKLAWSKDYSGPRISDQAIS
jgi:hypothetical protein